MQSKRLLFLKKKKQKNFFRFVWKSWWRRFRSPSIGLLAGHVAHIALDRTALHVDGHAEPITPGMAVTAEIKIGRRRVIDYPLAPLREYVHNGLRER